MKFNCFVVDCGDPLNFLPEGAKFVTVTNISKPALAGTNVTINCLSGKGDSQQTNSNNTYTITCMEDGRWEPELPGDWCNVDSRGERGEGGGERERDRESERERERVRERERERERARDRERERERDQERVTCTHNTCKPHAVYFTEQCYGNLIRKCTIPTNHVDSTKTSRKSSVLCSSYIHSCKLNYRYSKVLSITITKFKR